jgi:hypothetical protein
MRHLSAAALGLLLCAACVGPEDNPSTVKDLRVLGIRMDPPEIFADTCSLDISSAITFSQPVRLTALIADPQGQGRELDYTLWACAEQGDVTCREDRVELMRGVASPGELQVQLQPGPGVARLPDGTFLAQRVVEEDTYRGLGGVRMPLVMWVRGGEEQLYSQKLMVYGCRYFPEMQANVQPELPGLLLAGEPWEEGVPRELSGPGPFRIEPLDFTERQEAYVVPSFELKPVNLQEQWQLAWFTTLGRVTPNETGGADFSGAVERHRVEWQPARNAQAQEVRFWVTVRDGRGGLSWVQRTVKYTP